MGAGISGADGEATQRRGPTTPCLCFLANGLASCQIRLYLVVFSSHACTVGDSDDGRLISAAACRRSFSVIKIRLIDPTEMDVLALRGTYGALA
jgi:hypothetical protein